MRNTRRPKRLNEKTWIITDSASITKMPPIRSSSSSVCRRVMIARLASAPPKAIEPVSPMNTSAGNALYQRKPIAAPTSAAPMIARSRSVRFRCPMEPERTNETTFIAMNVKSAMIPVPASSPSTPSARFVPLAAPAITKKRKTYQPYDSGTVTSITGM